MSNRRKTRAAREGAPAVGRREKDGTVTLLWPEGRPKATVITSDALEELVAAHNTAVRAAPKTPRRTFLGRLGAWTQGDTK